MHLHRPPAAQRGFSLVELMVAVAIGLLILASLSTLFVKNLRTQDEIEKSSRQIENGRFAVDQITVDLRNAGFYAEFDPTVLPAPAALPAPCDTSLAGLKDGLVLPVQGADDSAAGLDCLQDVSPNTDILVVRRTSTCLANAAGCDQVADGGAFFQASLCNNATELNSASPLDFYRLDFNVANLDRHLRDCTDLAGSGTLATVRRYLVHIYYIAKNNKPGDGIPTLKRAELAGDGTGLSYTTVVPLAEGIENLQLEYGMDLAPASIGDGVADQYSATPSTYGGCATAACAISNWRTVVAVKLNLLARNTLASPGWKDSKTYVLGTTQVGPFNDAYRRHAFPSLINLPNPTGRRTP
jgi:type IV pilus assembly protein PilW